MRKIIVSFIAGAIMATSISVYADEGLQKIEAYIRSDLPITLDGKKVALENPPVMVDGSTYLRLRDVAKITGIGVNWNDATQTVELASPSKVPATSASSMGSGTNVPTIDKEKELYSLNAEISNQRVEIQGATMRIALAELDLKNPDNPNKEILLKKIDDLKVKIAESERKITELEAQKAQLGTP